MGCQGLAPAGFTLSIGPRRGMAKEIHVERPVRQALQGDQLGLQSVCAQHGRRQGAEPAGLTDRSREPVVLHTRHRGLDEGGRQPQAIKKCVHGFTVMVCPEQSGLKNNLTC